MLGGTIKEYQTVVLDLELPEHDELSNCPLLEWRWDSDYQMASYWG